MKKDDFLDTEATEANIELNERFNDGKEIPHKQEVNSATEANMAIQEEFYGKNKKDDVLPTYLYNNTPAIKINPDNE
ncbi:hypothetical protein D1B33_12295 [Lysinibacillus yapensis]|uniref:Uncharacterized protein n=1 Tax=Ureibacillus yapensis TaxID=2304605 RepID=A0A396S5U5_9BACL|nr:hypothetical protein [Lysinibacillus yapensis]RHW35873.1 hypothetical protein D1B33_12295 [Lysinibacillus yapensis]